MNDDKDETLKGFRPGPGRISAEASGDGRIFQSYGPMYVTDSQKSDAGIADLVPNAPIMDLDPYALGVAVAGLPAGSRFAGSKLGLTPYLERPHDAVLRDEISIAAAGPSVFVLLTGISTTGKTRALYEAIRSNQETCNWPMLRPIDVEELNALLNQGRVGQGMALWLNETQKYLYGTDGEIASRRLIRLLETTRKVIVVGAMWQNYYRELTATGNPGDPTASTRELLTGPYTRKISTPARMTVSEINALAAHPHRDARLTMAVAASGDDGEVIQHLTGGPGLVEGYLDGGLFNPVEHALITAALEARRLGHLRPLPGVLLAGAANGYLTSRQRPGQPDWASVTLTAITSGVRADNTRTDVRKTLTALTEYRSRAGQLEPEYEPTPFLDQNTRAQRANDLGTAELWDAMVEYSATAEDLYSIGNAAQVRGLFRYAAQMWYRAVGLGKSAAAGPLLRTIIRIKDEQLIDASDWIMENTSLDQPRVADALIRAINQAERNEVVASLALKAAEKVALDNLRIVASLIKTLNRSGANDAVAVLAQRVAEQGSVDSPRAIVDLLNLLIKLRFEKAVTMLAERASLGVPLDSSRGVGALIREMCKAGVDDAATRLGIRAARYVPLNNSRGIAFLLREFRESEANDALAILLSRGLASNVSLQSFSGVCALVSELHKAGLDNEAIALAMRAVEYPYEWNLKGTANLVRVLDEAKVSTPAELAEILASLKDSTGVNELARLLYEAGADQSLANYAALSACIGGTGNTGASFHALREAEAISASEVLAKWISERSSVNNPRTVAQMIEVLVQAAAHDAVSVLAFRAAEYVLLDDGCDVCHLIYKIKAANQDAAATVLAARAAEHVNLNNPGGVAELLEFLDSAQLDQHVATLISRNPAKAASIDGKGLARLSRALRSVGDRTGAANLLLRIVDSGGRDGDFLFRNFVKATLRSAEASRMAQYGREPDGNPSPQWGWRDLPRRPPSSS